MKKLLIAGLLAVGVQFIADWNGVSAPEGISDAVSKIGNGVINYFSHFDLYTIFSSDSIAFFVGIWACILFGKVLSVLKGDSK